MSFLTGLSYLISFHAFSNKVSALQVETGLSCCQSFEKQKLLY